MEKVKKSDDEIHKWIDKQMKGSSVTVVLIGAETSTRPHINYEIIQSHKTKNGMLGIYIHNLKDPTRRPIRGRQPIRQVEIHGFGRAVIKYPTYDWVSDDGYTDLGGLD